MSDRVLVSGRDLNVEDQGVVYLDATALLPGQSRDVEVGFQEGRLPGARRFVLDRMSDPESDLPHMVPSAGRFGQLMGALGVRPEDRVVCYAQEGVVGACRAWWMLRLFGHERVSVLDGGLGGWGGEIERGMVKEIRACEYRPVPRYGFLAGSGDVLARLGEEGTLVLDARSRGRFEGMAPEPRAGVRGGRIPGSVNLPYGRLVREDGRFQPAERLREIFAEVGVSAGKRVITSCGSGLTAAVLTVGLAAAGFDFGALYDGSWAEWGRDTRLPLETGPV